MISIRPTLWALACAVMLALTPAYLGCGAEDAAEAEAGDESAEENSEEGAAEDDTEASDADGEAGDEEGDSEDQPQRRERAINVTAATATRGNLVIPVVAEGTIRARRTSELNFEVTGRIERLHVHEGDRVRRGQPLATLDDREYNVALEEAQARYLDALGKLAVEEENVGSDQSAVRELEAEKRELARMEAEGTITREERRQRELQLGVDAVKDGAYRRELLEVRSGLAAARADEQRAKLNLERTVVHAPFDGVVTELTLAPGELIQVSDVLCTLVDDVELEAEVGLLESDLRLIEQGRGALLEIPALGENIPAKVDVISPRVDTDSRTCQVLLRIRSEDHRVKPGMFVRASIAGAILQDRLLVPREAILTRDGRPLVFRVDGERAKWQYVQLGERNDHLVEITGALQGGSLEAGDQVVVDNHLTLTHEAKIKVRKTVEPEDPWLLIAGAALASETP